jgi:hypothetical protein
MNTDYDFDRVRKNWDRYENLCRKLSDDNLNTLLDDLGGRLIMCPASTRTDQYGAYPGGMVHHALEVTSTLRTLNTALELGLPTTAIIKVGLLHDIGKVGGLEKDNFLEQDSDWHREKLGQLYKYNDDLNKMSTSHRTLFLLQHYSVSLSLDEWLAIQLAQGSHFEENRFYVGHEPTLAAILQQAKSFTIHRTKGVSDNT